jgi:hypothetical protein
MSDTEDVAGIVTKTGNCSAHETTSSFSGDAEAFPNFTEALALSVKKPEASFNGVPCPRLKGAKQFSEEVAFNTYHHGVFRSRVTVCHQVPEGCVAIVTDRLVKADRGGEAVQFGICLIECLAVAGSLSERSAQAC